MEYMGTLIVVADMEASKKFYMGLLGMEITMDFGANVTLDNCMSLQTLEVWSEFISKAEAEIGFAHNQMELAFEEADFDAFLKKLEQWPEVKQVHPMRKYPWGQRVVRMYDPDGHIVEVGESMKTVVKNFLRQGLTVEETMQACQYPEAFVLLCQQEVKEEK